MQQQNFKETLQAMSAVKGWELLEHDSLLALKAPSLLPFVNMVWGPATESNYLKAQSFYNGAPYNWHLTTNQKSNLSQSMLEVFKLSEEFPEMMFALEHYTSPKTSPEIKIMQVTSSSDLKIWAEVAIETFGCTVNEFEEFFYPLIETIGSVPFLVLCNNIPAATSLVWCGGKEGVAGIYAMSTKESFRRKGLGTAAVKACLDFAKTRQHKYAVLYASKLGEKLYTKLGFQVTQVLHEYCFTGNS